MADDTLQRSDVQGLLVRGYKQLRAARYLLGAIEDPPRAAAWLNRLEVATGEPATQDTAINVAFTATGLTRLGLAPDALGQFSREFLDGMTAEHRQRMLGDVDESAPAQWRWGRSGAPTIDVMVLVFARDDVTMAGVLAAQQRGLVDGGIRLVRTLETTELEEYERYEHFGFRDGISQPRLAALGTRATPSRDVVATGELVLGYRNAYGRFTPRPVLERADDQRGILPAAVDDADHRDLGRDGTYLVARQLEQDVEGFWEYCHRAVRRPDGTVEDAARVRLAAKMVGRWPSGASLALAPEPDDSVNADNDFAYFGADPHGLGCPIGSHVRRANPRDTLDPAPGSQASIAVNNHHRLLRRGRKYGPPLATRPWERADDKGRDDRDNQERGLHFMCLVANISRQFEFVQHSWLNEPQFNGLYGSPDPLLAPAPPQGRTFVVQADPVRERYAGLPRFVYVRGGAYFFLPGVRALSYLATLAAPRGTTSIDLPAPNDDPPAT